MAKSPAIPPERPKGPKFLRFFAPIVDALRELGNSGRAGEVTEIVIDRAGIDEAEREAVTATGHSKIKNQVGWARFYLVKAGLLDRTQRGVWTLTELGQKATLTPNEVTKLFKSVRSLFADTPSDEEEIEREPEVAHDFIAETLGVLRGLPPAGFERLCQRVLRESGFTEVKVTGQSGDGGIDGHGVLEVNPLVTFKVLFQCKRYAASTKVTPSQVRDFRGAMQGRADKGLIITTSDFTHEANREASRDGAPAIELVNGERLVFMLGRANLGLNPVEAYELDPGFFEQFR